MYDSMNCNICRWSKGQERARRKVLENVQIFSQSDASIILLIVCFTMFGALHNAD